MDSCKKSQKKLILVILGMVVAFYGYRFVTFGAEVASFKASYDGGVGACAIVVLTGGYGRADAGLELFRRMAAPTLILSGVDSKSDMDSIFVKTRLSNKERQGIILEKSSTNTYENALETRGALAALKCESMALVTSRYHMKRALMIFSRVMPEGVKVYPYIVESPNFDSNRWWGGEGLALMFGEVVKYDYYAMRLERR